MDIHLEKLRLIQWLAAEKDVSTIKELIALKKSKEKDWWDEISTEEKSEIEEGLKQADKGEVISHDEAMEKYKKWL